MGLACQKCFSCWPWLRKQDEPEPAELSDAEMSALLRKVINNDNSQKLLRILRDSLVNPNTPLPVTLHSNVDHKKLLCLLWTPLMLATYAQKLHVLRVLLDMQAVDVNAYDSSSIGRKRSALHIAARYNCPQSLELLVSTPRVAINAKDVDGCTALHLSAMTNNVKAVHILLHSSKHDIDVNAKNNDGDTPAHLAADRGLVAVMQTLMRHPEFDIFVQDTSGRDVLQRAQSACANLPLPPSEQEEESSDHRSVDDCTQLIHLLSKQKARSATDETLSEETKSFEQLTSVKFSLATNLAVRLLSTKEHASIPPDTQWQTANNLPLRFMGLGAPLGDVSDEDTVHLWNYLVSSGAVRDGFSTDTHEDDDEKQSLIATQAKKEHAKLLRIAIRSGDPTLLSFICSSVPGAAQPLTLGNDSEVNDAVTWLDKASSNPANVTHCRDWSWSQWICFFALHCDIFASRYDPDPIAHDTHPLATLKHVTDDCYALEITTKHMYVFDVLKYSEMACAVSLKFHDQIPSPDATEESIRLQQNELLECGEHFNQPTARTKQTLISLAVEVGMLQCSLKRSLAIVRQFQAGVHAA